MTLHLTTILLAITTVITAHLTAESWLVYYPVAFEETALCSALNCSPFDVCLVKGEQAFCIHENQLGQIHGLKTDAKTGLMLDIDGQYKATSVDSINRQVRLDQTIQSAPDVEQYHRDALRKHETDTHTHKPRAHDNTEGACNENRLKSMRGRLFQWFADVHKAQREESQKPLPEHSTVCQEHVSWMFQQWDGDEDGELTVDELRPVENDPYERCVGAYIDHCDNNGDNVLSLDEWCDCFQWTDDEHNEPPCHSARHKLDPHEQGIYIPRCTIDGYYRVQQCHQQHCWCVDKYGREFDRSRVEGRLPDCGQYAEVEESDNATEL